APASHLPLHRERLRRTGISWPRRTRPAPRLHLRPKARRVRRHQARAQTTIRHRTPHRPHEGRGSSRPLLPQGPCRRCRQRHPDRRRPQLPTHPRLAEEAVALNLPRSVGRPNRSTNPQSGFLTTDDVGATLVEYFASRTDLLVFSYAVAKVPRPGLSIGSRCFAANKVSGASRPPGLTSA